MTIQKVLSTDTVEEAFINKYNPTTDELIVSVIRSGKVISHTKEGGGVLQALLLASKNQAITGLEITKGANNLTFDVSAGAYTIADEEYNYTGGSIGSAAGDATNDRLDILAVDTAGALVMLTGTPAPIPAPPTLLSTQLNLATLLVKANATTGSSGDVFILVNNASTTSGVFNLSEDLGNVIEGSAGVDKYADLLDVDLTSLTDGDRVTWDSGSGKWIVQSNTFENEDDVNLTIPTLGDLLVFDGAVWVNSKDVGIINFANQVIFKGIASPATISSDQNDYNPTGLSTANVLRLNSSPNVNITGLSGGVNGRILKVYNVGSNNIILKNNSVLSAAGNRFLTRIDLTLQPNEGLELFYDGISSKWRADKI